MVVEASGGGRARGVTLLDERAAVARLGGVKRQIRVRVRVLGLGFGFEGGAVARRVHGLRGDVLDVHAHEGVAHDLILLAGGPDPYPPLLGVGQQVADILVIDLDHR